MLIEQDIVHLYCLTPSRREMLSADPRCARWDAHGRDRAAPQRQLQLRLGQGQLGPVHSRATPPAAAGASIIYLQIF